MAVTDAVGLLTDYDRWARETANADVDVTPEAFLRARRAGRAVAVLDNHHATAVNAVPALVVAIADEDMPSDLVSLLKEALAVCEAIVEAGHWE